MKPLVSICLPNLNTRPYLPPRMESILSQTNQDWELIICDSFSDDGSWEYFQQFAGDPRIQLHQVPKEGLYAGWNECVRRAKGRYIHMATSDDVEHPLFQESLLNMLESNPDCPLAYCEFREMDAEGNVDPKPPQPLRNLLYQPAPTVPVRRPWEGELLHALALWPPWVTMNSLIFRRDLLDKTGPFPGHMGSISDMLWGCRACIEGDALYYPEIYAFWRRHATQASPAGVPGTWNAVHSWAIISEMQKFLKKNRKRLPPHWLKVPHWRQQLQAFRWKDTREYAGFDRNTLRTNPKRFFSACGQFIRNQPAYFTRQILTGLPYRKEVFETWMGYAESLIDKPALFQIPPVQPLEPSAADLVRRP